MCIFRDNNNQRLKTIEETTLQYTEEFQHIQHMDFAGDTNDIDLSDIGNVIIDNDNPMLEPVEDCSLLEKC